MIYEVETIVSAIVVIMGRRISMGRGLLIIFRMLADNEGKPVSRLALMDAIGLQKGYSNPISVYLTLLRGLLKGLPINIVSNRGAVVMRILERSKCVSKVSTPELLPAQPAKCTLVL